VNLLVLPDDGLGAVVRAVRKAKKSVRVTLFRCDLREVEKALADAVARGVAVHALIAHTNRAGEKQLRALELRLLGAGLTVSRTDDDLARYHDKLLIVDEQMLFVLGFNFTRQDVGKRRSMAVATRKRRLVAEAIRLFDADAARQAYEGSTPDLVISPLNARARLTKMLKGARRTLWIYDPQAIDTPMLRILKERAEAGVDVRLLGKVGRAGQGLCAEPPPTLRLHLRAILRDDMELFLGSQGLRGIELDRRREVGVLIRDRSAIRRFKQIFEQDWAGTSFAKAAAQEKEKAA
jgi:phosphatidylserine/phosphatidylglycerophosphate/cardiolipin synthase-like enzyme